jgi:hypothetical protein
MRVPSGRMPASFALQLLAIGCAAAWLLPAPAIGASLFLQVDTPAVTLTPASTDYVRDYVEATGASGIQLRIKTNDAVGMSILVRCPDALPQIALNDFLVRTLTPPGNGGSALAAYTPIQATNLFLWSTGSTVAPFFVVSTDIRIRNLIGYNDSPSAGTTAYTNSLVFTVVSP